MAVPCISDNICWDFYQCCKTLFLAYQIRFSAIFTSADKSYPTRGIDEPEDYWSCIAHLSAEEMLKSAVIEEKKFKHSPRVGADNPLGPKF